MPKVVCSMCGATGTSKCPQQRNVFQDNGADTMFGNLFYINVDAEGRPFLKSKLPKLPDESDYEARKEMLTILADYLARGPIDQLACYHNWVMVDEPCIFGCCQPQATQAKGE